MICLNTRGGRPSNDRVGDYTVKLSEPAIGERLVIQGRILRCGRTLSVAAADVFATKGGSEVLCAATLVTVRNLAPALLGGP
jgi:acyl-coenzyme A thioesterase PaaI-like protein